MAKGPYYYYDETKCKYVAVERSRFGWMRTVLSVVAAAGVIGVGLYFSLGMVFGSPETVALKDENVELRSSLAQTRERIESIREELESLARVDQELYRTILQVDPIPEDVRKAGVGGTDVYADFQRFGPDTRLVLKETAENLDRLEREVDLQGASYRDLVELAKRRAEELRELPAIMPVDGRVVSGYGMRMHPIDRVRKMHYGIDITTPRGTPVVATADGTVKFTGRKGGYGITVEIKHANSGYVTRYTHLSKIPNTTRRGRKVKRGDVIALSGNTGRTTAPHVHYEILDSSGRHVNPIEFFAPGMTPTEYERLKKQAELTESSLD